MRTKNPRSRRDVKRADVAEPSIDVFEQPERSLLGDALSRPVGLFAALFLIAALIVFVVNQFFFSMKRIDDFALVAFFVGGGVLISVLLRAGEAKSIGRKKSGKARGGMVRSNELVLDEPLERGELTLDVEADTVPRRGLAEAPAASAPRPPKAPKVKTAAKTPTVVAESRRPVAVQSDSDDKEVASFQQALIHYVNAGDLHGQGEVLRRLGHLAKSRGHMRESQEFYVSARDCFRKIDDHYAEAAVLLDLGQVLESLDEHDAASAAYRDANRALLDVAMSSGDRHNAIHAQAAD